MMASARCLSFATRRVRLVMLFVAAGPPLSHPSGSVSPNPILPAEYNAPLRGRESEVAINQRRPCSIVSSVCSFRREPRGGRRGRDGVMTGRDPLHESHRRSRHLPSVTAFPLPYRPGSTAHRQDNTVLGKHMKMNKSCCY